MIVTFLGTGTSMGVPVAGGFKREELYHDPRNERTRCSLWIQTEETSILIDAGPDFRTQSIRSGLKHLDAVLITHEHMDHIGGLDDLRMYNYLIKKELPLYTTPTAVESIKTRFNYMFGEKKYPGSTSLDLTVAEHPFKVNELTITPLPVKHGDMDIIGFRINDFAYLTDVSHIPPSTIEKVKGCKTIVLSALRWEPKHPTHYTIPEAVEMLDTLGAERGYLIHMNSYVDQETSNTQLPDHIKLAYDMQQLRLS